MLYKEYTCLDIRQEEMLWPTPNPEFLQNTLLVLSVCVFWPHQHSGLMKGLSTRIGAGLVAATLIGAFLFALSLAADPQLHAWVHPDSQAPHHECAVTLIASGSFEHCAAPVMVMVPQPAQHFATIPTFTVVWVAAAFSSSAIFEHAPPALS